MQHEMLRQEGQLVPYKIDENHLTEIAMLSTTAQRKKFLSYLLRNELINFNSNLKKRERDSQLTEIKREALEKKRGDGPMIYGLGHNTIYMRLMNNTFKALYNWKAAQEFNNWGVPLVIDMSYVDTYKPSRVLMKSSVNELINSMRWNRTFKVSFLLFTIFGMLNCFYFFYRFLFS